MRLVSAIMVALTIGSAGAAQAHTVSSSAQAASNLLVLLASVRPTSMAPEGATRGDLSRSPVQLRRLALQARQSRR